MYLNQLRLKNGLETLFINSPGASSASVQIWFRAGSALEVKSNEGIAHFLEHMFFKGTKKRPGAAIAHEVESYGGEVNAFTSFDYTCYYINTPVNNMENTIEILMDMVANPEFKESELIPERGVVFEEYRRSIDNPNQYNFSKIQKSCFQLGYAHPILGTEKTIKNFSRAQVVDFRKKYYNLSNAMLVVAGDVKNETKLIKIIEKFKLPNGQASTFPKFKLKNSPQINLHTKDVRQASLTIAIEAPDYLATETAAEDLVINCLCQGETSRLYQALVTESQVATNVSGSSMFFAKGGIHLIRVTYPEKNHKKVLKALFDNIKTVVNNPFSEQEVLKIRSQYVASKIYEKETIEGYAFSLGHGFAQNGDIHCEDEFITNIKKQNATEVNTAFYRIFGKTIHLNLQLPKNEDVKKYEKSLQELRTGLNKLSPKPKKIQIKSEKSQFDESVQVINLKDSIKLIYRQNAMTPTFVMHAYLKGGQTFETPDKAGSFQLLSRMLSYGHKNKKYLELKEDLENKSAYLNGFSGKNAYGLTMHGQSEHFADLADDFFSTLFEPTFPKQFLDMEKELIFRALENQKEDPVKQCFKTFNKLVFNGHPYAMDLVGNEETITKANENILKKLHQERLSKSEVVFTYCGDKSLESVLKFVEAKVERLKDRKKEAGFKHSLAAVTGERIKLHFDREQSHIMIGKPSFKSGTKEDLFLKMVTSHLSGQSSQLFVEVRDRQGLCYSVQPVHHGAMEAGYWGIYIGAGKDKVDAAIGAIMDILKGLQKRGFTQKEFDRIKKMIDGQNQIGVQTNDDYAHFYSIPVLHNLGLDFQHQSYQAIRDFSLKEINDFLSKFLKSGWNIVEVGP
jgi:zinc protease